MMGKTFQEIKMASVWFGICTCFIISDIREKICKTSIFEFLLIGHMVNRFHLTRCVIAQTEMKNITNQLLFDSDYEKFLVFSFCCIFSTSIKILA